MDVRSWMLDHGCGILYVGSNVRLLYVFISPESVAKREEKCNVGAETKFTG